MNLNQAYSVTISSDITEQWRISDDVFQGTKRLRSKKDFYLPRLDGESNSAYQTRIDKAVLKNKYKKTLTKAIGGLLKNGITTNADTENVDARGGDLESFVSNMGLTAARFGICYVLVDAPSFDGDEIDALQMELMSFRPYYTLLNNLKIKEISYFIVGSSYELSYFEYQIVLPDLEGDIRKSYSLENGEVVWRIEKMLEGTRREIVDVGVIDISKIPIVPVYGSQSDSKFINSPPYLDLAYYNILHFQATSDASIAHHVAATPMLFMRDASTSKRDEKGRVVDDKVTISPWSVIKTTAVDSEISWVETNGTALTQHREWLKHIESDMSELSMNFNLESPEATATANNLHAAENQAGILFIKKELERGVREMNAFSDIFMGETTSKEFEINSVGIGSLTEGQMNDIEKLHSKNLISDEQYVDIVNRTLPFDIKYEKKEIDDKDKADDKDKTDDSNNENSNTEIEKDAN